jgi:3-hydroxybutyryl-CoA dehydrogenase
MQLYTMTSSFPVTMITGEDAERAMVYFARLLHSQNMPFAMICDTTDMAFLPFKKHCYDESAEFRGTVNCIVDLTWDGTLCEATLEAITMHPEALILSASVSATASAMEGEYMDFEITSIIRFNGIAGLFDRMETIELAPSLNVTPEQLHEAQRYFTMIGKKTEVIADRPGLIVPRVLMMIINEAMMAWTERIAEPLAIDRAMQLATNYPIGPLAWADMIGLDVVLQTLDGLYETYHDERYRASVRLRELVDCGFIGVEVGRGVYQYDDSAQLLS